MIFGTKVVAGGLNRAELLKMSQKTMLSYFKRLSPVEKPKRTLSTDSDDAEHESKKVKIDESATGVKYSSVLDREEENRLRAKLKLQVKKTPTLSPNIGLSWYQALEKEFEKPYFEEISSFVYRERCIYDVYPPVDEVFSWTNYCKIHEVKVVILGQDPYHGRGQAHGLAFSVPVEKPIPPSLANIYKELASDIAGFKAPSHGYLKGWAVQGVLLLNACLTVRARSANSHSNYKKRGWERLTDATIQWLSDNLENLVFLLWGAYAQKKAFRIDKKKHLILKAPHPSPLSASHGFFGCKHFSSANKYLIEHGKSSVDWSSLPEE